VLDIGCGAGQLAAALKKRQPVEVVGIERDATAARIAREVLDRVLQRDVEDGVEQEIAEAAETIVHSDSGTAAISWSDPSLEFFDRPFDCVICADVLEHLREPGNLLKRIRGWLSPEGTVVISAMNSLHAKRQEAVAQREAAAQRDEHPGPVTAFTRRELEALLDRSGYIAEPIRFVAAEGFTEWVAAGKPTRLQFGPLRVECASVGEAAEWFARSHLVVARPAAAAALR
jgi:SAM-dependent methyltransferase